MRYNYCLWPIICYYLLKSFIETAFHLNSLNKAFKDSVSIKSEIPTIQVTVFHKTIQSKR